MGVGLQCQLREFPVIKLLSSSDRFVRSQCALNLKDSSGLDCRETQPGGGNFQVFGEMKRTKYTGGGSRAAVSTRNSSKP